MNSVIIKMKKVVHFFGIPRDWKTPDDTKMQSETSGDLKTLARESIWPLQDWEDAWEILEDERLWEVLLHLTSVWINPIDAARSLNKATVKWGDENYITEIDMRRSRG